MLESGIQKHIALAASANEFTAFRQNTGIGWQGEIERIGPRDIIIRNARPVHFGLIKGSSDLIGWRSIKITPEMVGHKIAVFSAIECKTKTGRTTEEQQNFINRVRGAGGIAFVAREAADVAANLKQWISTIMTS